jgi:hypothetical protein
MPPAATSNTDTRLTRVELAVSRMETQVAQLVTEFAGLKEKVEAILCRLNDHHDILYGNHGESGLIAQGEHLEELEKALKGYGREPGLIADIKNLSIKMSEFSDERKWLTRLIIGAILTDILVHFIQVPH